MSEYKIGIVGGSGFVGSSLAKHLSKNFQVKVIDQKPVSGQLPESIEFRQCDIRNYSQLESSLSDVNLVIHTAIVQIPLINEAKRLGYEVNVLGTQNLCEVVAVNPSIKGLILTSSWHVFGESKLTGVIDEEFGFRPDKVQDRARLYALSKITQETIVRLYDELTSKIFGVVRLGTVLGDGMPEKTAANLFVSKGLKGEAITPYNDSMYRPMLYIDIEDVQKGIELYAKKILNDMIRNESNSLHHVVNLCQSEPVTILELAQMVADLIKKSSNDKIRPEIKIVDTGKPSVFEAEDKKMLKVNNCKAKEFLGLKRMTSPKKSLEKVISKRIHKINSEKLHLE